MVSRLGDRLSLSLSLIRVHANQIGHTLYFNRGHWLLSPTLSDNYDDDVDDDDDDDDDDGYDDDNNTPTDTPFSKVCPSIIQPRLYQYTSMYKTFLVL